MLQTILLCSAVLHTITDGLPLPGFTGPQRSVMFGGYYGYPAYEGRGYNPQAGDELSGRKSASSPSAEETRRSLEAATHSSDEDEEADDEELFVDVETTTAAKPKNKKRIPKRKTKQDESEDNDDSHWPFNSRNGPSYNSFFPIMFGGSQGSRTRSADGSNDGYYPGGATAIANSFSTGKGGVATSHATSFGDPYNLLRSGFFNTKNGNNPQQPQHRQ